MLSGRKRNQPACLVAHDLLNKLSAIIGHCDLLNEMTEQGTEYARRISVIRELADSAAKELAEHQRKLANEIQKAG